MLEIREQIFSLIKERKKLLLSVEKNGSFEMLEYQDSIFVYFGGNSKENTESFRYSLSPKQALAEICDYYRDKGNITSVPGYKEVYKYMIENP